MTLSDDAVEDIADAAGVGPEDVTVDDVRRKVGRGTDDRVTGEVADLVAQSILTTEDVMTSVEASGELPREAELGAFVSGADGVADEARRRAVEEAVDEQVLTREEVDSAVREQVRAVESSGRDVTREDVEQAVQSAASGQGVFGTSTDDLVDEAAVDVGAPSQSSIQRARTQTVAQSESVEVSDVVEGSESSDVVNVIRDESGEVAGVVGRQDAAEVVAEETGGAVLSPSDAADELEVDRGGGGRTVDLKLRGRTVGEVDVE